MSDTPYIPFYTSDFLAGTGGMTAAVKGVYITLLCLIYEAEGPIPQQWETLARRCGCTLPAFKKAVQSLSDDGKVVVLDDGIWSEKCAKHIAQRCERRNSAKAAAEKRWKKSKENQGGGDATASSPQCQPEPEPESEKKEGTNVPSQKAKRKSRLPDDWRLPNDWGEWAIGKGLDELSVRREAEQFANHHHAKGSLMMDWRRAWQTWVNNAIKWQGERQKAQRSRPEPGDVRMTPDGRKQVYINHYDGWMVEHA